MVGRNRVARAWNLYYQEATDKLLWLDNLYPERSNGIEVLQEISLSVSNESLISGVPQLTS
jgi:hypothetical protein